MIQTVNDRIPWNLTCNLDQVSSLFKDEGLPYEIRAYFCGCGTQEMIPSNQNSSQESFLCPLCGNNFFNNAKDYIKESIWYESIETIVEKNIIEMLQPRFIWNNDKTKFEAIIALQVPKSIDWIRNKIIFEEKKLLEVSINNDGELEEISHTLMSSSVIQGFHSKIIDFIKRNPPEHLIFVLNECDSLDQMAFFLKNTHLRHFQFYYWREWSLLPHTRAWNIVDALTYTIDNRHEKSFKKALFVEYQKQITQKKVSLVFARIVAKSIIDVNIARKMLALSSNFSSYSFFPSNSFEDFLTSYFHILKSCFSEKQIAKLFVQYSYCDNFFWFGDTLGLLMHINPQEAIALLRTEKCHFQKIHDILMGYDKKKRASQFFDTQFNYDKKMKNRCIVVGDYRVKLPLDGKDLYDWSEYLHNCLSSYIDNIIDHKSILYGFFLHNNLEFAIELKDTTIIQAKSKHNNNLTLCQEKHLEQWLVRFQLKRYPC